MNNLVKRTAITIGGLVLVLAWWTFTGKKSEAPAHTSTIPAQVWEGGPVTLKIDIDSTEPGVMDVYLHGPLSNGKPVRQMEAEEKITAGTHSWTLNIPPAVGGRLELDADKAGCKPGSKLSVTASVNGKEIGKDSQTLSQPLHGDEAFYVQVNQDDFSVAAPEQEEQPLSSQE